MFDRDIFRDAYSHGFGVPAELFDTTESSAVKAEDEARSQYVRRVNKVVEVITLVDSLQARRWLTHVIPFYKRYIKQLQRAKRRCEPLERGERERRRRTSIRR